MRFKIVALILLLPLLGGCAAQEVDLYPLTGSKITPEWEAYNTQSSENDGPTLEYIGAFKKIMNKHPYKKTDVFSLKDDVAYFYVKWNNVFGRQVYSIKIYDPRGVLFLDWSASFKYSGPTWSLWVPLWIRDAPASRLPGEWTAKVFMNGHFVTDKKIIVGDTNNTYQPLLHSDTSPSIAVLPFIPKGSEGRRHTRTMPLYLSQALSIDFPEAKIIDPWSLYKKFNFRDLKNLDELVDNLFKSEEYIRLVNENNIKVVVLGLAEDNANYGEDKEFRIYVIDATSNDISKKFKARWQSSYGHENTVTAYRVESGRSVYKKLKKEAAETITSILAK